MHLSHPRLFPLELWVKKHRWNLSLNYDVNMNAFSLRINGEAFLNLPRQAEVAPNGPQHIANGSIVLNQVQIHKGFTQYNSFTFKEMC